MSMDSYHNLVDAILDGGERRKDRTGVGTLSLFGEQVRFTGIADRFPLVTRKNLHWKSIVEELLWFIRGESSAVSLEAKGVNIWREWGDPVTRDMGPIYGVQWRNWAGIDQLQQLIDGINRDPFGRRHILSAWNVEKIPEMALPPCHVMSQFYVTRSRRLHCHMYQRSADVFLGLPFNIASYALLTHIIASLTGTIPDTLVISIGDAHIYQNHVEQCELMQGRTDRPSPLVCVAKKDLGALEFDDILLANYEAWPAIKAPVAV